jgi:hypothetical protein
MVNDFIMLVQHNLQHTRPMKPSSCQPA